MMVETFMINLHERMFLEHAGIKQPPDQQSDVHLTVLDQCVCYFSADIYLDVEEVWDPSQWDNPCPAK